ncbi:hypothetical protein IAQ61_001016 [Plenodomus lingam]|uniref:uncharacterized protein n=1 Tax=Leptosphaeria maculans TaxID=5022 RepID=UPI00332C99CA|nr:hypothetical protein IAQ61_001016 [Plenodomus lingam]
MSFRQAARDVLPYSPKHVSTLLRRDIKDLKTKFVGKVKSMFKCKTARTSTSAEKRAGEEANTLQNVSTETSITKPEEVEPVREPVNAADMKPAEGSATLATEEEEGIETLYTTLEENLQVLKESRDKDAPADERWHFRGCWLLLYTAMLYCPSNPFYEALGCGKTASADAAVRAKILEPTTVFSSHVSHRCDEVLDTVMFLPEHWWIAIWEATTSHAQAVFVAEALLRHIWPENDAAMMLKLIGNPYETLFEFDAAELQRRLQVLLFPELQAALHTQL